MYAPYSISNIYKSVTIGLFRHFVSCEDVVHVVGVL
jgi:hypothetical protein